MPPLQTLSNNEEGQRLPSKQPSLEYQARQTTEYLSMQATPENDGNPVSPFNYASFPSPPQSLISIPLSWGFESPPHAERQADDTEGDGLPGPSGQPSGTTLVFLPLKAVSRLKKSQLGKVQMGSGLPSCLRMLYNISMWHHVVMYDEEATFEILQVPNKFNTGSAIAFCIGQWR